MISRIVFDDVSLTFGEKTVFDKVSVELKAGRIISIVGANGSGKSTFLNLAGQFIKPTSGTVTAFDGDMSVERIAFRKNIAAVTPIMALYSELTAAENINFFVGLRDISLNDSNINALFESVGLSLNDKNKCISSLLAVQADVWLLDEPGSNLDDSGKRRFLKEIKQAADDGKLILLATNDKDEAEAGNEIISLPIG